MQHSNKEMKTTEKSVNRQPYQQPTLRAEGSWSTMTGISSGAGRPTPLNPLDRP